MIQQDQNITQKINEKRKNNGISSCNGFTTAEWEQYGRYPKIQTPFLRTLIISQSIFFCKFQRCHT